MSHPDSWEDPPEDDEPELPLDFEPPFEDDEPEEIDCKYWRNLE